MKKLNFLKNDIVCLTGFNIRGEYAGNGPNNSTQLPFAPQSTHPTPPSSALFPQKWPNSSVYLPLVSC